MSSRTWKRRGMEQNSNHLMIHPEAFLMMDGAAMFQAKEMTITILDLVRIDVDDNEEEDSGHPSKEPSSQYSCRTPRKTQRLNQTIRSIKANLGGGMGEPLPRMRVDDEDRELRKAQWAILLQSIVQELNGMHESREMVTDL
jgi:hypothetical protein